MKFLVWIGLIALPLYACAQQKSTSLQIGYLGGQITHPGINLGISQSFFEKSVTKNNGKTHRHEFRYGAKFGGFYHHNMHTGLLLAPEASWLLTKHKGSQIGFNIASGYMRTFIPNTFSVDEGGNISRSSLTGNHRFIIMPSVRLGKDLSKKRDLPIAWYIQPTLMWQYGGFNGTTKYFLVEAGITYQLSNNQ